MKIVVSRESEWHGVLFIQSEFSIFHINHIRYGIQSICYAIRTNEYTIRDINKWKYLAWEINYERIKAKTISNIHQLDSNEYVNCMNKKGEFLLINKSVYSLILREMIIRLIRGICLHIWLHLWYSICHSSIFNGFSDICAVLSTIWNFLLMYHLMFMCLTTRCIGFDVHF